MPGMPALPEDAEACGAAADRALRTRGVELPQQAENGTCPEEGCSDGGAAGCYCGFRLRRLTCGATEGRRWAPPHAEARRLERDCARVGGLAGCSRCLRALNQLKSGSNSSASSSSSSSSTGGGSGSSSGKQDCQLMGLTWLLTKKNGSLYLPAATSVLRVLLATDTTADDHTTCTVASVNGAMPLAVDSAAINGRSVASDGVRPSASWAVQYLVLLLALIIILLSTPSF
ncbi:uncharacterized GPI-anchored protein At4g28100-like [Ananas comosus]|uniref:Uncharacterized GPI-anchored protein At4g28100-like n=1 Tax=Ananas comosus TaxID=4615 RepID=A0A6P5FMG9_ANACO|nr:uncharacterized GPI-anchored protein At4g28100-like [Ananas comosus]